MAEATDISCLVSPRWSSRWLLSGYDERRSLTLCAAGALAGLIIAGVGLFSAQGTRIMGVPAEDVALVNGVQILMSDYDSQLRSLYYEVSLSTATPEQKRKALDNMIREELYVQRSIELGLQNDVIEVRAALVAAVEAQQEIDVYAAVPTEEELRAFYESHAEKYQNQGTIALTDFVGPNADVARRAAAAIQAGQPVADAMAANGLRSSGAMADGEEFYFAAALHLDPALFAVAKDLRDGEVSAPIDVGGTVHVLVMQRNVQPRLQRYEQAADRVLADYRAEKIARLRNGADGFLRKRADIQIAKGFE